MKEEETKLLGKKRKKGKNDSKEDEEESLKEAQPKKEKKESSEVQSPKRKKPKKEKEVPVPKKEKKVGRALSNQIEQDILNSIQSPSHFEERQERPSPQSYPQSRIQSHPQSRIQSKPQSPIQSPIQSPKKEKKRQKKTKEEKQKKSKNDYTPYKQTDYIPPNERKYEQLYPLKLRQRLSEHFVSLGIFIKNSLDSEENEDTSSNTFTLEHLKKSTDYHRNKYFKRDVDFLFKLLKKTLKIISVWRKSEILSFVKDYFTPEISQKLFSGTMSAGFKQTFFLEGILQQDYLDNNFYLMISQSRPAISFENMKQRIPRRLKSFMDTEKIKKVLLSKAVFENFLHLTSHFNLACKTYDIYERMVLDEFERDINIYFGYLPNGVNSIGTMDGCYFFNEEIFESNEDVKISEKERRVLCQIAVFYSTFISEFLQIIFRKYLEADPYRPKEFFDSVIKYDYGKFLYGENKPIFNPESAALVINPKNYENIRIFRRMFKMLYLIPKITFGEKETKKNEENNKEEGGSEHSISPGNSPPYDPSNENEENENMEEENPQNANINREGSGNENENSDEVMEI
ncbi:MAG: hypothetical protein MJ252_29580, partial [archaeon]|nr:hypothetical protein [archaeon]